MGWMNTFARILALLGTAAVWLPVAAMLATSVPGSLRTGTFRIDYLMPAELFPLALVGGVLLILAAVIARSHKRLIGWGFGLAVGALVAGQALAVATGLASGETEPVGFPWALVVGSLALYTVGLVVLGCAGVMLTRFVCRRQEDGGD
ncbi:MAG: hypothetical protein AB1500_04965 [Bacillota bacterium]